MIDHRSSVPPPTRDTWIDPLIGAKVQAMESGNFAALDELLAERILKDFTDEDDFA